jgi:hypothetical protein
MSVASMLAKAAAKIIKNQKKYDETVEALGEVAKEPKIENRQYQGARYGYDSGDIDEDYFYVVHGGADFDDLPSLDSMKTDGLGEKGIGSSGINPLGQGTYGFLLDPTNLDEGIRAIKSSQGYSKKYGTKYDFSDETGFSDVEGKVHVFKIKKSDAGDLASRSGLLGFPNKTRPDSPIMATEQLPVGLTEVSISKPELLERIGKIDIDADESTIKKFIRSLRGESK